MDGDGNYNSSDISPVQAARRVLPRSFGNTSPAVEAIFKGWTAYRQSKMMWRPNPAMPAVDVTPAGCIRARPVECLSKHRPFLTIGASLPRDPVRPPPAGHVDPLEFPELERSPNEGIGCITGSNEAPKATTQDQPAFRKPVDGQAAPRPKEGALRPASTTSATTSMSTATNASTACPLNGRQHQHALVKVDRMSEEQVQAAQKVTPPKEAGPASTPSTSKSKPEPPKEEAMDTDGDQSTQQVTTDKKGGEVTTQRRSGRSASGSWAQKDKSSSRTGKMASTSQGSKSQPSKSGPAQVQQALKQAGGLEAPRAGLGPITKRVDATGKKAVDYCPEAFPAPTFRIVQPGGGHLKAVPIKPRVKGWVANTRATQAEAMVHLRALAQGGRQQAEYRDHSHWLQDWDNRLQQLKGSQEP